MKKEEIEENGIKYNVETDHNGNIRWYHGITGCFHRENGPAVIFFSCPDKFWYKNGLVHRDDGPAIEAANGTKYWCKEGLYHREDGPAIEYFNGDKEYWLNDEPLKDIKTDEELIIKLLLE